MLFAAFFTPKADTAGDRLARWKEWQFPKGVRSVAWYHFPASEPRLVEIFEADSVADLMEIVKSWDDVYDITVLPTEVGQH